jgi:hypothetical protein
MAKPSRAPAKPTATSPKTSLSSKAIQLAEVVRPFLILAKSALESARARATPYATPEDILKVRAAGGRRATRGGGARAAHCACLSLQNTVEALLRPVGIRANRSPVCIARPQSTLPGSFETAIAPASRSCCAA